jgi:undecaprenyl-diphosphatase
VVEPREASSGRSLVGIELVLLIAALLVGFASWWPVSGRQVPGWERSVFRTINDLPGFLYGTVWVVMQLGSGLAIAGAAMVALVFRRFRLAGTVAIAAGAANLLSLAGKAIVNRPRPAGVLAHVHVRGAPATGNGYPSGHAAVAFALATIAWLWFGPRVRWAFFVAAVIVCFGRVYVGAHFPLDVVGGAALGVASGAIVGLATGMRHHGHAYRRAGARRRAHDEQDASAAG